MRRGLIIFSFAVLLVLSLVRAGEVQFVTIALIAALAVALHRAGPRQV